MYTIRIDRPNDWAEVLRGTEVIYRGHIFECYEALVELVATTEEGTVVGPRLDAIDQIGGIRCNAATDYAVSFLLEQEANVAATIEAYRRDPADAPHVDYWEARLSSLQDAIAKLVTK